MAWPPSDIGTSNTDAGTDNPQIARGDILGLMQGFNLLRNHFSTFMRGFAEAVDAPAARGAIGAADAAATVNLTGAQTVAGLKTFSGGHLSTSTSQAIGYGVGAGAQVTQLTSKFTTVTINRPTGSIITHNQSLAAGASADFVVNNSTVPGGAPVVFANPVLGTSYEVITLNATAGSFRLRVTNITGGALAEQINISFVVLGGVAL